MLSRLFISMIPVIVGGILNMIFVKSKYLNKTKIPIDRGLILKDEKRLFGENKTYKGFLGMILCTAVATVLWGYFSGLSRIIEENNIMYSIYENGFFFNLIVGLALGFSYVLLELPNSFIKRRLDIGPGQSKTNILGIFFICFDQVDSLFGCALVLSLVSNMTLAFYFYLVLLGGIIHYFINILLYLMKLKRNI